MAERYFDDRTGEWVYYDDEPTPSLWTKLQRLKQPEKFEKSQVKHIPIGTHPTPLPVRQRMQSQVKQAQVKQPPPSPPQAPTGPVLYPHLNHHLTPEERQRGAVNGGRKGGPARALKLSPLERSTIARKAADARWRRG